MPLVKGVLSARRMKTSTDLPVGFETLYSKRLREFAFKEPLVDPGIEPVEGWVEISNLLGTEFENSTDWFDRPWAFFSLRVDKKTIPAKLIKAKVKEAVFAWRKEHDRMRCPAAVKAEIKEAIVDEWLKKTTARPKTTEIAWNTNTGLVYIGTLSEGSIERIRKRFFQTFGLTLKVWSPLDDLGYLEASRVQNVVPTPWRLAQE